LRDITHNGGQKIVDVPQREGNPIDQTCDKDMHGEKKHAYPSRGTMYLAACVERDT
jgi:hypothetical protein